ncbi:hypothetical protein CC80DRAFT_402800 [Byssothecium circinans]|uniref:Ell binding protein Ebp1 C-terminal domain-containing protein n=1 Tax=Byssothecium circinans TaxID=147558 RepID=A0A6A5UBU0_9PLEO|nr:hypothetical protein CC80DRAFT_402800 [Byssothecium circinans]
MSGPERPPETVVPTTKLKRKHLSDEDQAELEKLDRTFKRIKAAVPPAPYILSTPSLYPYHYHSRHEAQAWMMGRLFRPDEEHLQYRTFLFREPYQDCFTLQPDEDNEPEHPQPKPQPTTTAASQAPKKKISLSAYKSKQANGVITPGSKKVSPNLPPTKALAVQANGVKPPEKQPPTVRKPEEPTPQKRPAPEVLLPNKPEKRPRHDRPGPAPAAPQKSEPTESQSRVDKSDPSNSTPHGLPPLLSPVDQPLSNPYGLPPILSPTLPSTITEELKKLETQRDRADSNTSSSSTDRKSQLLAIPEPSDQKQDLNVKTVSRERSVSMTEKPPAKVPAVRAPSHEDDKDAESLVVKLKYTKKTRDTIKQLLKLPPKREGQADKKKDRDEVPKNHPAHAQKKPVENVASKPKPIPKVAARLPRPESSKNSVTSGKVAEKRPRVADDSAPPTASKRPRTHTVQEGPSTPKDQNLSSPANRASAKSSAQKSQATHTTPRKDLKAINMLRANSADGHDSTPGRGNTPLTSKHLDGKAPTSSPLNSKKQADVAVLQQMSIKLNHTGRALKYDSKKFEDMKGGKKDDRKRAAVIALECILAYMTAFHTQDLVHQFRGRLADVEGTWKMLLNLCISYHRLTNDSPHLDGFRSYLGAVIAAVICTLLAPRAPNPQAHDSPHELPHAELAKQHGQLTENFAALADNYMQLLRHTQDARAALPIEEMQKVYPKTWSGAESNTKLAKVADKTISVKLSGPYFLPIANDTTAIQAVRFGLKFLREYCEKERLDHVIRINLDRPE